MTDSERITHLKNYLKVSFNRLAQEIGLGSAQTFYDIRNGRHNISKDVADKITTKYLNINKTWLLTGEGEMLISEQEIEVPQSEESAEMQILKIKLQAQEEKIKSYERELERITNDQTRLLDMLEKLVNRKSD